MVGLVLLKGVMYWKSLGNTVIDNDLNVMNKFKQ